MEKRLPALLCAVLTAAAVTACEGPQGPAGLPGEDGPVGPQGPAGAVCGDCHDASSELVAIQMQFDLSPHGFQQFELRGPDYAGGSCVACHTHEGFIAAATGETADFTAGVASMNCRTCHQIHSDPRGGSLAMTRTAPVTIMLTGETVDFSTGEPNVLDGSNLCAACHQGRIREPWPTEVADLSQMFEITSSHFGPHYSTQANVYASQIGIGFGSNLPTGIFGPHAEVGCAGCHMESPGVVPTPGGEGGHNFRPTVAVCNECHLTPDNFDFRGVASELRGTLEALGACLEAEGIVDIELVDGDGAVSHALAWVHGGQEIDFHPVPGTYPEPFVAAYVVWAALVDDGSWGVHQPDYALQLAGNTLAFMEENSAQCPVSVP